ncbi:hypothetical protein Smp_137100 [Schistosoma mansoni]|uniref:Uncharacterized protein n=1 Tax=Schistosoma mansoni TaxID=6183 RepID=G4VID1_SCHMA|nr:hypothetical protein Smp_137100 [Schistosoma mansoni]|eukprot:XP_018651788.1 hypothetical protein Smp_137100 [Schistosoma mansoni]
MDSNNLGKLPPNTSSCEVKDHSECYDARCLLLNISAHFTTATGREAYGLLKTPAYSNKPTLLWFNKLRRSPTQVLHATSFETR